MFPLRWLFLDLNSYFASVEQQERPELRGKPVGVVPMLGVNSTCCLTASYEAKAFGVKTGTNVAEARLLCPGIQFVEARHDVYVTYHHRIVEAVESCLPVADVLSIDEMVGRLYGREQDPEEALKLARHTKTVLAKKVGQYLKCSIGLAPNRFLAKVAGEMKKPDGLTMLQGQDLPQALFKLQLRDLPGIGRNMEARLRQRGINTIQQLCSLDDQRMHSIWGGINGDRYAAWLRGEEVDQPRHKNRSLGHSHVLDPDSRTRQGAFEVAKLLTAKAALRLRKMDYWAAGFAVAVRFTRGGGWERHVRLPEVQNTPAFIGCLKAFWKDLPVNVTPLWVGVTMAPLVPPQNHAPSLFGDEKKEQLSKVMDAINEKYGKNTATYAGLTAKDEKAPTRIPFSRVPELWEF